MRVGDRNTGLRRILRNVVSKVFELLRTPYQVVELVNLPKFTASAKSMIDLASREAFPFRALFEQPRLRGKRTEEVHVVRHHDSIGQEISLAIKSAETLQHNFSKFVG